MDLDRLCDKHKVSKCVPVCLSVCLPHVRMRWPSHPRELAPLRAIGNTIPHSTVGSKRQNHKNNPVIEFGGDLLPLHYTSNNIAPALCRYGSTRKVVDDRESSALLLQQRPVRIFKDRECIGMEAPWKNKLTVQIRWRFFPALARWVCVYTP